MAINIAQELTQHMKDCVYEMVCNVCGKELDRDIWVDSDMDLRITVDPCEHCLREARQEEAN